MVQPPGAQDPHTVGRYRITGVLGAGGMGRVLLGEAADGRRAAIKLVHPELAGTDGFRVRFRREVTLAAQAPPGWTAAFLDADPDAERPWLATAYLDAPTLYQEIDRAGTLSPDRAADLGVGLASALAALHARGLVHRDLKPSNVLLTRGGPRLIDFGISRAVDGTALTATGEVIGTPEYLSPEQVTGTPPTGTAADLFALGSLLVFTVTARTPFAGGAAAAVLSRVVHAEPDLGPELGWLEPVVRALLDKDPARRPEAEQAAELLAGGARAPHHGPAQDGTRPGSATGPAGATASGPFGPGGTRRSHWWTDGPAAGDGGPPGPLPPPTLLDAPPGPGEPWRRRRWPLITGGVALALTVALVAGTLLLGGGDHEDAVAGPPETTAPPPPLPPATTTPATTATGHGDDLLAGATVVDVSADVRYGDADGSLRFRSPSGNIACVLEEFAARCDVLERTWEVPPVPASCRNAYGTGAELAGAAPGTLTCVGDTVADPALPVLEFGRALRGREVTCVSRRTGVECRNTTTGHGIAVARASYRVY